MNVNSPYSVNCGRRSLYCHVPTLSLNVHWRKYRRHAVGFRWGEGNLVPRAFQSPGNEIETEGGGGEGNLVPRAFQSPGNEIETGGGGGGGGSLPNT